MSFIGADFEVARMALLAQKRNKFGLNALA